MVKLAPVAEHVPRAGLQPTCTAAHDVLGAPVPAPTYQDDLGGPVENELVALLGGVVAHLQAGSSSKSLHIDHYQREQAAIAACSSPRTASMAHLPHRPGCRAARNASCPPPWPCRTPPGEAKQGEGGTYADHATALVPHMSHDAHGAAAMTTWCSNYELERSGFAAQAPLPPPHKPSAHLALQLQRRLERHILGAHTRLHAQCLGAPPLHRRLAVQPQLVNGLLTMAEGCRMMQSPQA